VSSSTSLRLANGPLAAPVLCRVVSMVMARANCPMSRLEDAMLVCDAISAHAPAHSADGRLAYTLTADESRMELRVAELSERGAHGLLRDAGIPGVGNVLERVADEVRVEPSAGGGPEELVLAISF
jgi:hypothetical protein